MDATLLLVAIGVLIVGVATVNGYTTRRTKRRGLKLTAQVVTEEVSTSFRGLRTYHTRVRFQAPDGHWAENVAVQGHGEPHRPGDTVDVWYDPARPTHVILDERGMSRMLFVWVAFGLVIIVLGVFAIIRG